MFALFAQERAVECSNKFGVQAKLHEPLSQTLCFTPLFRNMLSRLARKWPHTDHLSDQVRTISTTAFLTRLR